MTDYIVDHRAKLLELFSVQRAQELWIPGQDTDSTAASYILTVSITLAPRRCIKVKQASRMRSTLYRNCTYGCQQQVTAALDRTCALSCQIVCQSARVPLPVARLRMRFGAFLTPRKFDLIASVMCSTSTRAVALRCLKVEWSRICSS